MQPRQPDALKRLVVLLGSLGRTAEAAGILQPLLAHGPTAENFVTFGNLLFTAGQIQEAADAYREAVALDGNSARAHFGLANALHELGEAGSAEKHFAGAAELRPEKPLWRLRARMCMPVAFENAEEIEDHCGRLERVLADWEGEDRSPSPPPPLPEVEGSDSGPPRSRPARRKCLDDLMEAGAFPMLSFSYHGRDQRQLKERFAAIYEPYFRDEPPPAGSGLRGRKRIGFLVTRRHEGVFLRCMQGLIGRLDADRWEVVILASQAIADLLRGRLGRRCAAVLPFADSLPAAIRQVRATACDAIHYWEVGTDPMNYFLPFARPAPVQCTGWGSTITSGVSAVDHFISSDLIETAGSDTQYTERLWRSRTLFAYEPRLPGVCPASASHFGLPEGRRLYVCFQNPLKIHPDADGLFAGILAADSRAVIVLSGRQPAVVSQVKQRLARRLAAATERIVFLPPQPLDDYYRLLCLADVVLDTPHYGAGSSCYDLFSFNLPVVTWPGELIVGRITQACYRKMGVEDLIADSAEDYIGKAVRVATDGDYRRHVTEQIAARSHCLFNDVEAVREHERFFQEVLGVNCSQEALEV